jgi:hypothetical protein
MYGVNQTRKAAESKGCVMDPIVLAFGTALVGAIATSTWQQVRDAAASLWRHVSPKKAQEIGVELDELRDQILQARHDGDIDTEAALEGAWQLKTQQLLRAEPALAIEFKRVLEDVLTPALTPDEKTRVGAIMMMGSSHDSSTFTQIGIQTNYNWP